MTGTAAAALVELPLEQARQEERRKHNKFRHCDRRATRQIRFSEVEILEPLESAGSRGAGRVVSCGAKAAGRELIDVRQLPMGNSRGPAWARVQRTHNRERTRNEETKMQGVSEYGHRAWRGRARTHASEGRK
jgi:hypothetical protein